MDACLAPPRWGFWPSLWFWCGVAWNTVAKLRLQAVLESRLGRRAIVASGTHHVPREGGFVFCVNHYHAGSTLDVVSATLLAAERTRPRVGDETTIVVGQRLRAGAPWFARSLRWVAARFFRRWGANVLRIRTGTAGAIGIAELRAWRARATKAPTLVFPEGAANRELGSMKEGVGPWLRGFDVPVIPSGCGGARQDGTWRSVRRSRGRHVAICRKDLQLGLAMAELLPAELAPAWSELLGRWQAAHAS